MEHQYHVIKQDVENAVQHEGVFRSLEEAQEYERKLGLGRAIIQSARGDRKFGTKELYLDVSGYWAAQAKFIGDHKISGND